MQLTWYGHSCFSVTSGDYTVVLDPFTGVDGYPDPQISAQLCLCSHEHFDHNFRQAVTIQEKESSPFVISRIETYHDDKKGKQRGGNRIYILQAEGITIAHLGDLGHRLSPEQIKEIGPLDGVLLPVGGTYTIDPITAKQVAEDLQARVIIPMHYRTGSFGFSNLADLETFLKLYPKEKIVRLAGRTLHLEPDTPEQVAVLAPIF
jgi:L-ascorbate metabolism protein UlaG (beta-lactamase superfamily)